MYKYVYIDIYCLLFLYINQKGNQMYDPDFKTVATLEFLNSVLVFSLCVSTFELVKI